MILLGPFQHGMSCDSMSPVLQSPISEGKIIPTVFMRHHEKESAGRALILTDLSTA